MPGDGEESSPVGRRHQGKFYLQPPPEWTPDKPYTEPLRRRREVRFVIPGTKKKSTNPDAVTSFNSAAVPQPFLDPEVLERWRRDVEDGKSKSKSKPKPKP